MSRPLSSSASAAALGSGSRRGRSRTAKRRGGTALLAGLSGRAEEPPQNSEGGKSGGEVADADRGTWYRELFAPSVTIGLLKPGDLAGYRWPGLYPQVDACAAEPGRGAGRHAGVLRSAVRRAAPSRLRGARALIFVYIHP